MVSAVILRQCTGEQPEESVRMQIPGHLSSFNGLCWDPGTGSFYAYPRQFTDSILIHPDLVIILSEE